LSHFPINKKTKNLSKQTANQTLFKISISVFVILLLANSCLAQNREKTFILLNQPDGSIEHQLTISITETLYEYYLDKDHRLYNDYDLSKFVTPNPLEPVANNIWEIYNNEEDFANGVLMITHQIPYSESAPQKYPIETLVENEGDCDLFCFLAASILKAGGIDVVLLLYESEEHMALGINLSQEPNDARTNVYYVTYENTQYYVAESTGNFEGGWRVGECPDLIKESQARIIPLDEVELSAPSQVSTSYRTPEQTSLFMSVSTKYAIAENEIQITGLLSPSLENRNITLYISSFSSPLTKLATVTTDSDGRYVYLWNSPPGGVYSVRADWSGDAHYASADSNISQIVIVPFLWLAVGGLLFFLLIFLIILSLASRRTEMENMEQIEDWEFTEY
jgi:hypothetical protein